MQAIGSLILVMTFTAGAALAADSTPQKPAFGTAQLQLRLRVENVDDAAFADTATATTLRTRLSWTSPGWRGWQAVVEADDIRAIDERGYNSTVNGVTTRPVIADPVDTELNRAVLEYRRPEFDLALGRQRLTLDNQRFIGNVGWRQNEQTYDGATLRWHATKQVDVTMGWVTNVNRVFGPRNGSQAADFRGDSVIAQVAAKLGRFGSVSAFWYGLDFDNAPGSANATAGLLWTGSAALDGKWKLPWAVSVARQTDHGGNPVDYAASYRQLEIGLTRGPLTVKLGQELLDGDAARPNRRFQTPLATLHAFQGWADRFLVTPQQGIDDRYLVIDATWSGFTASLRRHDFRAEASSVRYGTEWDASVSRKVGKRLELLGKLADYNARGLGADTTKIWVMATASF
jgi:hypothetical protein